MQPPKITTAIPQRRYQLADYSVVVLGEIESTDPIRYRYVLALVKEGEPKPSFYVTCEKNPRNAQGRASAAGDGRSGAPPPLRGAYRLRVISAMLEDEIESSDRFADLDVFCDEALRLAADMLGLGAAEPERLM